MDRPPLSCVRRHGVSVMLTRRRVNILSSRLKRAQCQSTSRASQVSGTCGGVSWTFPPAVARCGWCRADLRTPLTPLAPALPHLQSRASRRRTTPSARSTPTSPAARCPMSATNGCATCGSRPACEQDSVQAAEKAKGRSGSMGEAARGPRGEGGRRGALRVARCDGGAGGGCGRAVCSRAAGLQRPLRP